MVQPGPSYSKSSTRGILGAPGLVEMKKLQIHKVFGQQRVID